MEAANHAYKVSSQSGVDLSVRRHCSSSSVFSPGTVEYQRTMSELAAREARRAARLAKRATQRPRGPKLRCPNCNEHPSGFRGRHELERHTRAKHNQQAARFRCVPPPHGAVLPKGLRVYQPFDGCKNCSARKQYNSEQNAIDHLRRRHFSPKKERGGPPVLVNLQELTVERLRPYVHQETTNPPAPAVPGNSPAATTQPPIPTTNPVPAAVPQPPAPPATINPAVAAHPPVPMVPYTRLCRAATWPTISCRGKAQ
ncbi:hypothetical protein M440DRAFT_1392643 [Trichoderma longibrachiatum ATCC 18648]|uniref:DUF7896 domain-containing protein n=1 Tax=Trichoderma longibrachiatum ATCC 18648 TaxID=983965 RepID=A0A2T4C0V0_TRILO|nr:hypothetical protein M440DRAFT_1392643 [Trichoderma longibrachiatum ATCC 18648]